MTLDGYTDAGLREIYAQARRRVDDMHAKASRLYLDGCAAADDPGHGPGWREMEMSWEIAMAAAEEACEQMEAITDELELRADRQYGTHND